MAAKGFFVPMARSGRIPKKAKVKEEDKGEEGGCLLQVLGSREVDLVQKILNFLDPVCANYKHGFEDISEFWFPGVSDEAGVDWGLHEELHHKPKDLGFEGQAREKNPGGSCCYPKTWIMHRSTEGRQNGYQSQGEGEGCKGMEPQAELEVWPGQHFISVTTIQQPVTGKNGEVGELQLQP